MARTAVVFDAIGTVFSLHRLERRLGGPGRLDAWFERLLHSATALTLAGEWAPFDDLAESTLRTALARMDSKADAKAALGELKELPAYPEASDALDRLAKARVEIAVLTNGGERSTRELLEAAELDDRVTEIVSVEDVEVYKPHPAVYRHAAERIGVDAKRLTLVAAHAWDVVGAKQAGWNAVWVNRFEREWPFPKGKPRRPAVDLVDAVELALAQR
jgi:2-haloacid dehalogenase